MAIATVEAPAASAVLRLRALAAEPQFHSFIDDPRHLQEGPVASSLWLRNGLDCRVIIGYRGVITEEFSVEIGWITRSAAIWENSTPNKIFRAWRVSRSFREFPVCVRDF
jgi:hypothetical protein